MINRKFLSIICLVISIGFLALLVMRLASGTLSIQTNMLELLPEAQRDAKILAAIQHQRGAFTSHIAFLIGAPSKAQSQQLALSVAQKLKQSTIYTSVFDRIDDQLGVRLYEFYRPYRNNLLDPADLEHLQVGEFIQLQHRVLSSIMQPGFGSALLQQDPLLLFTRFLTGAKPYSGSFEFDNGMLSTRFDNYFYTLVYAEIKDSPFSLSIQKQFKQDYQSIRQQFETQPHDAVLLSTGMIHNASAGTDQAKSEISTIGLGSLLGILVLFLFSFASLRPILFALLPITVGVAAAVSVCAWVFESIHIMTLVFGSSLIGVSIDYSLHFFAEQSYAGEKDSSMACLKKIMPGISLGLLTSLIGYAAFFIAPFPGLRQMALFSSVGLIVAYSCVVFFFPYLPSAVRPGYRSLSQRLAERLVLFWQWHRHLRLPFIPLVLIAFSVMGLLMIEPNDDIRLLDNTPERLQNDRQRFESIAGINSTSQFILVSGASAEQVLQNEERLRQRLQQQIQAKNLLAYRAISNSLPSLKRQAENYDAVRTALDQDSGLQAVFAAIGYDSAVSEQYVESFRTEMPNYLQFEQWRQSEFFDEKQWLQTKGGDYLSLVNLYGLQDVERLREQLSGLEGVQLVDQVADITQIFGEYRVIANRLVLLAYFVIFLILLYRYRLLFALQVLLPPLLAGAFALAMSGFLGLPLTLFNTLALLLVLGIGIDYTLFFAESKGERAATMMGILLSAITTILSFGLLALSSTPALQSIGLTVLCGISVAFLLAPMVESRQAGLLRKC